MAQILDDKSEHCIPFITERIVAHREYYSKAEKEIPPFFLGLNGVQGAGKTTLVSGHVFHYLHCIEITLQSLEAGCFGTLLRLYLY